MNWHEEVLKRKDHLFNDLNHLLEIESTKDIASASDGKPMGPRVARALDFMLELSSKEGFRTTNHHGYYGYAEYGPAEAEEHIAVLGHLDVVPATGEWTSPPFEPTIRNGKLFARGAIDDKGPTMAAFYALKLLKEMEVPMKRNVRMIFGTDEESGMSCLKKYREVESHPVAGFAPDAMFPIIHAEKGQMHVKCVLNPKTEESDETFSPLRLLSFSAGERPNMVPETVTAMVLGDVLELEKNYRAYLKKNDLRGDISTSANGQGATLTLYGQSAHSMEPFKGINAPVALAHFLVNLSFDKRSQTYLSFIDDKFYKEHYGEKLGVHHTDEVTGPLTVNPAIFDYENQEGFVQLNIRYPVSAEAEIIERRLAETSEKYHFSLKELRNKNPHHVDQHTPMIQALQTAYQAETNLEPTLLSSGGNTYASLLPNCVAYGAVFPGKIMTAHQKDEYIEVDDLLKATAIYAHAIYLLANMDE
ncbi:dipeptidase PepV [Salipaludibacillus daqingensis]|uniref:dipeptidase PepV n=1 Tax=Salipaludibacillus daqingensis TaxID=3041001 RepID=UPI0024732976|nr:dipeptidase PepV [Salipaludibacillus daqingensis]